MLTRLVISLLIALGTASSLIHITSLRHRDPALLVFQVSIQLVALSAGALALIICWGARPKRDTTALAWLLSMLAFAVGVTLVDENRGPQWYVALRDSELLNTFALPFMIGLPGFMAAAFARFTVVFPRELRAEDSARLGTAPYSAGRFGKFEKLINEAFARTASSQTRSRFLSSDKAKLAQCIALFHSRKIWLLGWIPVAAAVLLWPLRRTVLSETAVVILAALYVCTIGVLGIGMGAVTLYTNYRAADEVERGKMLWIVEGFVAALALMTVAEVVNIAADMLNRFDVEEWTFIAVPLAFLIVIASVAAAAFFRGALDPRLMIRKTTISAGIVIIAIFAFAGIETLVADLLAARLGFSPRLGSWIAGGAIAIGLRPLHSWVEARLRA